MKISIALKPWFFSTVLVAVILVLVFFAHLTITDHHDTSVRLAIQQVLTSAGYSDTQVGNRIHTNFSGLAYRFYYEAEGPVPGSIALVRLQGSLGPALAVFFIKQTGQITLCGFAGIPLRTQEAPLNQAIRLGITPRTVERWTSRLNSIIEERNE